MPVKTSKDSKGCFAQWGDSGAKYHYDCGNDAARENAVRKAEAQGRAARANGYRGNENVQSIGEFVQELVGKLRKKTVEK